MFQVSFIFHSEALKIFSSPDIPVSKSVFHEEFIPFLITPKLNLLMFQLN